MHSGETGAQQMYADVGLLKQTLLDLPNLGQANATNAYTKLVNSEVGLMHICICMYTASSSLRSGPHA